MTSTDRTVPATRRPRKSTGSSPVRKKIDKENITVDVASTLAANGGRKKLRSKSMGPGGLDVLKSSTGNRRVSLAAPARPPPRSILKPTIPLLPEIPPHKSKSSNRKSSGARGAENLSNSFQNEDSDSSGTKVALRTEEQQQAAARDREERERAALEKEIHDRREARRKSLANRRVSFAAEATLHTFHEIEYMQDSTTSTDSSRRASSQPAQSPASAPTSLDPFDPLSNSLEHVGDVVPESPEPQRNPQQKKRRSSVAPPPLSFNNADDTTLTSTIYSSDSDGVSEANDDDDDEDESEADSDSDVDAMSVDLDVDEMTGVSVVSGRSDMSMMESDSTLEDALRLAARRAEARTGVSEIDEDEEIIPSFGWVKQSAPKQSNPDDFDSGTQNGMEMDMDMTNAVGGILTSVDEPDTDAQDEDMSMELTRAMGGVLPPPQSTDEEMTMDMTMDMTMGLGKIIPPAETPIEEDDTTMGMEMTMAIGGIIKGPSPTKDRTIAKQIMEQEADQPDDKTISASPSRRRMSAITTAPNAAESESPGISAFKGRGLRRSTDRGASATPKSSSPVRYVSPPKSKTPTKDATPKKLTAKETGPSTPLKTPPSRKGRTRSASPKRPTAPPSTSTPASAQKTTAQTSKLFQHDLSTGVTTPRIVLTPQKRRLSGLGIDKSGLGSPKVAEIFDRRGSIGESAGDFVPGQARNGLRAVVFVDPKAMENEVDQERRAEEDRESGRSILEREADGLDDENSTATLKDMISSMTPRKNAFKGRKSLHVGSAKGLLGKRPAELDDEDDAEDRDGVKRLKGHQSSPVKNVRLHAPPSKAETTGRVTRNARRSLEERSHNMITPTLTISPNKKSSGAPSPQGKSRFKDIESDQPTNTLNFEEIPTLVLPDVDSNEDDGRIHLQDFLNMTSIRFMELNTTKRRHTTAPTTPKDDAQPEKDDISLQRCVVAGACTVPMLELYQHSCRELKKYISEGRRIVREIETETLEENPPLFREYISATPEFKILMDNQFKNVKTHARLLSKAMWYEWRMKLQDGLKEGLIHIGEGLSADEQLLRKEQELLDSIMPALITRFESLEKEHEHLESAAQELADCDPEELEGARNELREVDSDIASRMQKIEELRQQLEETQASISEMTQKKQMCQTEIEEAEKIREECRGWTSNEVSALKAKVDSIEKQHGWAITGISGTTISTTYMREIELVFDIASFQGKKPNARIDLWYIAANRERNPQALTPEREFFIQCIRDHVRSLSQARTKICDLLKVVSAAWKKAMHLVENLRLLNITFPTMVSKTSDTSISVRSALMLAPLETKVEVVLGLQDRSTQDGVEVAIIPEARVVYGEHFKVDKVAEFLSTRIGKKIITKEEDETVEPWGDVVVELHQRLLARGRKSAD